MVPWTHWREPRLGRLLTDLTSEFTVFNLVIRLSKGKQSALLRVSPIAVVGLNYWPLDRAFTCFSESATASRVKPPFSNFARETAPSHSNITGNRHVLFLQVWSSWFFGEVNHLCT